MTLISVWLQFSFIKDLYVVQLKATLCAPQAPQERRRPSAWNKITSERKYKREKGRPYDCFWNTGIRKNIFEWKRVISVNPERFWSCQNKKITEQRRNSRVESSPSRKWKWRQKGGTCQRKRRIDRWWRYREQTKCSGSWCKWRKSWKKGKEKEAVKHQEKQCQKIKKKRMQPLYSRGQEKKWRKSSFYEEHLITSKQLPLKKRYITIQVQSRAIPEKKIESNIKISKWRKEKYKRLREALGVSKRTQQNS